MARRQANGKGRGAQLNRLRLHCIGAVQGVGFRPTVYRVATTLGLAGWVANDARGAIVEVEGPPQVVAGFERALREQLPPLARLDGLTVEPIPATGEIGFEVRASEPGPRAGALVPPDAALCADCRHDIEDASDRRHHYPFTTCTNCGPRFSLVRRLPYDRHQTSMACFPFCPACAAEYADPGDRRFHAEPVCCPACGPRLWLAASDGRELAAGQAALTAARDLLRDGRVLAVKGLGGFQLACRADRCEPVILLRERKRRPSKPFAVMVRDLETARGLVDLSGEDEALMTSARSPVVLAIARRSSLLSVQVAPGLEDLGVLLPTTPLHVELLRDSSLPPLVMTSGNVSDEPICRGNREALERLGGLADAFLLHDRDVVRRVDDSVVRTSAAGPFMVRRARGWVPEPIAMPVATERPMLAVGGHLQVTACLAVGDQAFLTQHVGDLDTEPARRFLVEVIEGLEDFLQVRAGVVVADCHPDYPSRLLARELAEERGAEQVEVQHHLAHAVGVLAEHGRTPEIGQRVLAVVLDGTGYGPDATAWGGEWLDLDGDLAWSRVAHLEPLPLVGGERAVREPWRVAVAALAATGLLETLDELPIAGTVPQRLLHEVGRLAAHPSWPRASGAGRLFEAFGALLGLAATNRWEGEAAMRLESLASTAGRAEAWPEVDLGPPHAVILPSSALIAAGARRLLAGEEPARVAAGFHATFAELACNLSARVAPRGSKTVALGGGCLVNRHLRGLLTEGLDRLRFEPLLPRRLPPGDGGLAYGQVAAAALARARGSRLSPAPRGV